MADLESNLYPDNEEKMCYRRYELGRGAEWLEKAEEHQRAEFEVADFDAITQVLQATLNEQVDTANFQLLKIRKFNKSQNKKIDAIAAKIDEQTAVLRDIAYYLRILAEK